MKKIFYFFPVIAAGLCIVSCNDDGMQDGTPAPAGSEINFGALHGDFDIKDVDGSGKASKSTRTVYGDRDGDVYPIYWDVDDQVAIYCPQASAPERKEVHYKVVVPNNEQTSGTLAKVDGGVGLRWGESNTHHFYGFYPADAVEGVVDAHTIRCNIPVAQYPEKITREVDADGHYIYTAYPNMDYAYMYAHNTADRETQGENPVQLDFKPLITTLEITVNGPSAEGESAAGSYQVNQITVRSSENISGEFNLTITDELNAAGDGACTPVSGGTVNNIVSVSTYWDDPDDGSTDRVPVTLRSGDRMVVKAFLLPYANPEKSQTAVTVSMVGQGSNTKILQTADIESGKINITSLPALRGTNFSYWMSSLDENTYFSQLSIPGTHNSYAYPTDGSTVSGSNTVMDYYQNKTIQEQFNAGARAFSVLVGFENATTANQAVSYGHDLGNTRGYTYWNNVYTLYVKDGHDSNSASLSEALSSYATMLSDIIKNYKAPAGRTCQEFIILNLNFRQLRTNGDNYEGKFAEVKRWLKEVDRTLMEYNPSQNHGIELETNIDATTTIADLKGKIVVFVNYQCPDLPNAEGAVSNERWQYGEEYEGYTYTPSSEYNYIFMRNAYSTSGSPISQSLYTSNDRDIDYAYYMVPEGSAAGINVWKQELQRLNNPVVSVPSWTDNTRIDTKISIVKDFFQMAIDNNNQEGNAGLNNWYINNLGGFCVVNEEQSYNPELGRSGNTVLAANQINGEIYRYLTDQNNNSGPLGVVLMNFLGDSRLNDVSQNNLNVYGVWLPQVIIENNFRFALKSNQPSDASYNIGGDIIE